MPPTDVRWLHDRIRAYLTHLDDPSYICDLAAEAGLSALSFALLEMLAGDDQEAVAVASMFIGDATSYDFVHNGERHCTLPRLHDALIAAGLFDVLSNNLHRPNASVRHTSIHRLSRSSSWTKGGHILLAALPYYMGHYPLELPSLLNEISWRPRWSDGLDLLRQAARHPLGLTRWATVESLESRLVRRNRRARKAKQLLRQLAQDPNLRIRAEARAHLRELRGGPASSAPQNIRGGIAIREYISFAAVSISVSNFLHVTQIPDYTFAMVDDMARWLEQRPFAPGEDADAYYGAFGKFHESRRLQEPN